MPEHFDPYHRWLGIPPKQQPPDYYRLLSIERFEDHPEVIADAAEQQIAHVRRYQRGRHSDLSQQILNELAQAKACLLDPKKKAEYDRQLSQGQIPRPTSTVAASSPTPPSSVPHPTKQGKTSTARVAERFGRFVKHVPKTRWAVTAVAGVFALGAVLAGFWAFHSHRTVGPAPSTTDTQPSTGQQPDPSETPDIEPAPELSDDGPESPSGDLYFDLPVPEEIDVNNRRTREAMIRANQDARELRAVDAADPDLPDLSLVKQRIASREGHDMSLAARDPRVRVEMVTQEGGTTLTEAAVSRGLQWLAAQQQSDGRWRLDGGMRTDSAATSLALLAFLGAGQTHLTGRHEAQVALGLRWLLAQQAEDGDLRAGSSGNTGMYAHGQGAIVLCEVYLMSWRINKAAAGAGASVGGEDG